MNTNGYINGFIQRNKDGRVEGNITIDGVSLSPIEATFFEENGKKCLWLKRKQILEYDEHTQSFRGKASEPRWEAYLIKQSDGVVAYKGDFHFFHFRYSIVGIWDNVFGKEKNRLNLFVERLPMSEQSIINNINNRNVNGER